MFHYHTRTHNTIRHTRTHTLHRIHSPSTPQRNKEDAGEEKGEDGKGVVRKWRERSYSSFSRSFQLPKGAKPDHITASCENGVLSLNVPGAVAKEEPKSRQIKVQ